MQEDGTYGYNSTFCSSFLAQPDIIHIFASDNKHTVKR